MGKRRDDRSQEGYCALCLGFMLEALGLALDPLDRELRPLPMILAVQSI